MRITDKTWMNVIRALGTNERSSASLADLLPDSQLVRYVEALTAGAAPEVVWAELHQRLAAHPDALAELEMLMTFFQTDETVPMIQPTSPPRYTLAFIPKPAPVAPIPTQVAALWQSGRHWVRDQMGVLWIDFAGQILGQSPLQPVLVTRGSQDQRRPEPDEAAVGATIYQLSIGSEELGDLDLEIKAVRTADPAYCTLIVTARIPSRWPDLAGIEVVVLRSEPTRRGQTNAEGEVSFDQFPITDLERIGFTINPAGDAAHEPTA